MPPLSRDDLTRLATFESSEARASLYLPTVRSGSATLQNPIRFRNLLDDVRRQLHALRVADADTRELLAPADAMLLDDAFWQHQRSGLAVFLASRQVDIYKVPEPLPELAVASRRYSVRPLLPLANRNRDFLILALSLNEVRVVRGDLYGVREIEIADLPTSVDPVRSAEPPLQFHTGTPGRPHSTRSAVYHGHEATHHSHVMAFLRTVDERLHAALLNKDPGLPVVLAGDTRICASFREVTSYGNVTDEALAGNAEDRSLKDLHSAALLILEPLLEAGRERALHQYETLDRTGQASSDLEEILPAAHEGRVETLLVSPLAARWGEYIPSTQCTRLVSASSRCIDHVDLLDLAAQQVLQKDGRVYTIDDDPTRSDDVIGAVFRY